MASVPLSTELALRIALAARAMEGVDAARLLVALIRAVGEPITDARLARLRPSRLRNMLAPIDEFQLRAAMDLLKGKGVRVPVEPLPVASPYREGDMPESVRIACASNAGTLVDGSFSGCPRFLIYQVSATEIRLVEVREVVARPPDEDRNAYRAGLLRDCKLLYAQSIGGPAAAKVVRAGVHPVKTGHAIAALEVAGELQAVLAGSPPPWLAKAMGTAPMQRMGYQKEELR